MRLRFIALPLAFLLLGAIPAADSFHFETGPPLWYAYVGTWTETYSGGGLGQPGNSLSASMLGVPFEYKLSGYSLLAVLETTPNMDGTTTYKMSYGGENAVIELTGSTFGAWAGTYQGGTLTAVAVVSPGEPCIPAVPGGCDNAPPPVPYVKSGVLSGTGVATDGRTLSFEAHYAGQPSNVNYGFGYLWSLDIVTAPPAPPNQPPVANAGPEQTAILGESVQFDGSGSSDPDGTIASYVWSFGDGAFGQGVTTSHTYATAGFYPVKLTVTDDDGATATGTTLVTIQTLLEAIGSLSELAVSCHIQHGITNSLDAKLENAQAALQAANAGQRQDAANKLLSFINAVEAQRGRELTIDQADALTALALRIVARL
jgi:PKD repeat protein